MRSKKEFRALLAALVNEASRSFLAGVAVAIGGTAYLLADNKLVGAILFSIGLFAILELGFSLFTGVACFTLENRQPKVCATKFLFLIPVWIFNFAGAYVVARIEMMTRFAPKLSDKALDACRLKIFDSNLSLFVLGILCEICIYIAVVIFVREEKGSACRCMAVLLGVISFIMCGFEHSIADMYYFSVFALSKYTTKQEWLLYLLTILAVTGGNLVGAVAVQLLYGGFKE